MQQPESHARKTRQGASGRVKARQSGSPHYISDVGVPNSTLAVEFRADKKQCFVVPYVLTAETDNMGLEAWVKPYEATQDGAIAWNGDMGWGLLQRGKILCCHLNGMGDVGAFLFEIGRWYHVAMVRDDGVTTFYVNGNAVASDRREATIPWGRFWIGCTEEKYYFNGAIDEIRYLSSSWTVQIGVFTDSQGQADDSRQHVEGKPKVAKSRKEAAKVPCLFIFYF